jgi:HEPN domain-containing protein
MPPEEELNLPAKWLEHAMSDLVLAKTVKRDAILLNQLCFHAQQCVEKSIKAVLLFSGVRFPRSHNIKVLYELIPQNMTPQSLPGRISILTDYAVESRYPGDFEEITEEEYHEAVLLAEKTFTWAKNLLITAD